MMRKLTPAMDEVLRKMAAGWDLEGWGRVRITTFSLRGPEMEFTDVHAKTVAGLLMRGAIEWDSEWFSGSYPRRLGSLTVIGRALNEH